MLHKTAAFFRREKVLTISAACALLSMAAVPPDAAYAGYIDWRVLALLFCLMTVVAGVKAQGMFHRLARELLGRCSGPRPLTLALVLLPFFASMLVTNDVALITFVPFAVLALSLSGREQDLAGVVALQAVAANLGSMATPVGNPQNLYLYTRYGLSAGEFFGPVLPLTLASLLGLVLACLLAFRGEGQKAELPPAQEVSADPRRLWLLGGLFLLCLLSVFRVLPYPILLGITLLYLLVMDRKLLPQVDYSLLLTFVCFFIFSGNLGRVPAVREFLGNLLEGYPVLTPVLASQVISNVPAAVLLSSFTENWRGLLVGTNVGGLGTPVASLASLIALRGYLAAQKGGLGRYLWLFTLANLAFLLPLLALAALLG